MHIAVKAGEEQKKEFLSKAIPSAITIQWLGAEDALNMVKADAYFDLLFSNEFIASNEFITIKPVFADAVCCTAKEIGHANYIRINAWSGFLAHDIIEIAALNDDAKRQAEPILQALGWKYAWAPDEPGMIAPRVISMIINEAYFALGENISTKEEIDTAMKLGTNYPYGPFEWGLKIGLEKIYYLLKKLQQQSGSRYIVAPLLEQEVTNNGLTA
jgi:3-hydroxybutyryl-CoA dehydrogenase